MTVSDSDQSNSVAATTIAHQGQRPSAARDSLLRFATRLVLYPIIIITSVLVARYLGPASRGHLAYLMLFSEFFAPIATLGFGTAITYSLASRRHRGTDVLLTSLLVALVHGVTCALLIALLWKWHLLGDLARQIPDALILLMLIAIPIRLANLFMGKLLEGDSQFRIRNYVMLVRQTFLTTCMFLLVVILGLGLAGAAIALFVSISMSCLGLLFLLFWLYRPALIINWKFLSECYPYGFRAWFGALALRANLRFDRLLLSLTTSASALGNYAIASRLSELLWEFPAALSAVLFNKIARETSQKARIQITESIHRALVLCIGFLGIVMGIAGFWLIPMLYGPGFAEAAMVLVLLLPGTIATLTPKVLSKFFGGTGMPGKTSVAQTAGALVGIGFYFLLIPTFDIMGAAVASSLGYLATTIAAVWMYRSTIAPEPLRLFRFGRADLVWVVRQLQIGLRRAPHRPASAEQGLTMPKYLLNITHGFQARMLLRSSISESLLANDGKLIVCSPNVEEEYFRREFSHPLIDLEKTPARFSRLESHAMNLRQYILMNPSLGGTLNYKREQLRRQRPLRWSISRALNLVLGRVRTLRTAYMAVEGRLFDGDEWDALLDRHQPDLVVTGTPGFNPFDIHLIRAAKRKQIPTATVMLSWDNLTSKGFMNGVPDHLLVWSDLMTEEAVRYHAYPKERILWTGAAQFDVYDKLSQQLDVDTWRQQHDIPDGAALIVYGTINPAICPHEVNILQSIVNVIQSGRLGRPAYLWIRLHPQMVKGAFAQSLQPFLELQGPQVRVEVPPVQSEQLSWDLPQEDALHLAELMVAADIVVTTSSTLSIDAACAGTPIINVFFDGEEPVDSELSASRFRKYTHYAEILKTGGIFPASRIDEFTEGVNAYCDDPTLHAAGRHAIIRQQLNQLDGFAGRRTAEALMCLARDNLQRQPVAERELCRL